MRVSILMLSLSLGMMLFTVPAKSMRADDQTLIAALKDTPVSQIEAGFPDQRFGTWLEQHSNKGSEIRYFVEACEGSIGNSQSSRKDSPSCVTVTRAWGIGYLVMQFMIDRAESAHGRYNCKFLSGSEGPPPGSRMARPTRLFHKLSEIFTEP